MYNSQNLPLSPKKVIKKTITRSIKLLAVLLALLLFLIYALWIKKTELELKELLIPSKEGIIIEYYKILLYLLIPLFIILYFFAILVYEYFYYKLYFYDFTEERAEIRKGVISRATGIVRYERIQNIYVDQDFWDRIFGLYDVHFETAGETSGFYSHVDGLSRENAYKLVKFLSEKTKTLGKQVILHESNSENEVSESQSSELLKKEKKEVGEIIDRKKCQISELLVIDFLLHDIAIYGPVIFIMSISWLELIKKDLEMAVLINAGIFFVFIFSILDFAYNYIWYNNFYFVFKRREGIIKTKVISQSISYLYYNRIQNINIFQDIFDRIFQLYQVRIENFSIISGSN